MKSISDRNADTSELENAINNLVYKLYQLTYSSPKSFMRKIGLRLRSANDIRWLSEAMHRACRSVEASHNSFRIAIYSN